VVHLYLHHEHFDVITRLPAFFGRSYACPTCNKGYSNREDHLCNRTGCPGCHMEKRCPFENWVHCKDCNRYLPSQNCYNNHKTSLPSTSTAKQQHLMSVCEKIKRCPKCEQIVDNRHSKRHVCDQFTCRTCKVTDDRITHFCYIQPIKEDEKDKKKKGKKPTFFFFDFETQQDLQIGENQHGPTLKHVPNFCVAYRLCDGCKDKKLGHCTKCGQNRHVFKGDTCLDKFGHWLFSQENRGATVLAHNARGFDSQFLLEYLHKQGTVKPKVVTRGIIFHYVVQFLFCNTNFLSGLEVLSLEAGGVRVIDTLNFLPMPLSAFPKTFGITESKRGIFPISSIPPKIGSTKAHSQIWSFTARKLSRKMQRPNLSSGTKKKKPRMSHSTFKES